MGNSARHLSQRAQQLLLHHSLLRLAQIVVGLLQGVVDFRLMRGQGDMLTQLLQELALAAAETIRFSARADEDPARRLRAARQ